MKKKYLNKVIIGNGVLNNKGVYAARDFKKDEIVIKYILTPLTRKGFEKLPEKEKWFAHILNDTIFLFGEPERYVNHSDTPNTFQAYRNGWCDIALKDIKEGEEITTDSTKEISP